MKENKKKYIAEGVSLSKVRSCLPKLSISEDKVAKWVLNNVDKISKLSMNEIAKQCDVSDTTVLRFCKKAGFHGFLDLKISLIRDTGNPSTMVNDQITKEDSMITVAKKVFLSNIQAIQDTIAVMDFEAFAKVIELICNAKSILIVGVGTSVPIITDMYNKLVRLSLPCKKQTDSYLQLMEVALLGKDDLVIAITQSGSSTDPVYTLKQAKENGCSTVCITGNANSPITNLADVTLLSVSNETRPETIASRIAQISIVDALYMVLAMENLETSLQAEKQIWEAITIKTI